MRKDRMLFMQLNYSLRNLNLPFTQSLSQPQEDQFTKIKTLKCRHQANQLPFVDNVETRSL